MEIYLKAFFFKVIAPILFLAFFAYALTIVSLQLQKAWKAKNFKQIWLYLWLFLVVVYFMVWGGKL